MNRFKSAKWSTRALALALLFATVVVVENSAIKMDNMTISKQPSKEINQLVESSKQAVQVMSQGQEQTQSAVKQVSLSSTSLATIAETVGQISNMSIQITSAAEEINRNIVKANEMSVETATGGTAITQASQGLSEIVVQLQSLVGQFQVSRG